MKFPKKSKPGANPFALDGQLLIAMPSMRDKRFARSVIYVCAHSDDGAMGLIINKSADHIEFTELLRQLDISDEDTDAKFVPRRLDLPIHVGGPVERGRGFVLHSTDYFADDSTLAINGDICLTATTDILQAIASGKGPQQLLLALGYAGWSAGQLEREIQANGWLHCKADPTLVFDHNIELKYHHAMSSLGIDPSFLVNDAGHA